MIHIYQMCFSDRYLYTEATSCGLREETFEEKAWYEWNDFLDDHSSWQPGNLGPAYLWVNTHLKFHSLPLKSYRAPKGKAWRLVFQPSFFRGEALNFGGVFRTCLNLKPCKTSQIESFLSKDWNSQKAMTGCSNHLYPLNFPWNPQLKHLQTIFLIRGLRA